MYLRKKYYFKDSIEVEENHSGRYGAPGERRTKRSKPTPEQIEKQNQKNKEKKIRRLIKKNFGENDYWLTFTYRAKERPPDMETAKQDITKFLRKLKREYKKRDSELKYIVCAEIGSRGGIHHHMIINRIEGTDLIVKKSWDKGGVNQKLMYEEGGFRELAEYIAKKTAEDNAIREKWYSRSRNLIIPEPERKVMSGRTWRKEPKPPKGYYLDKESLVEGINPVTNYKYRSYTFVKMVRRRE